MTKYLAGIFLLLLTVSAQAQSFNEGRFRGIFARDIFTYSDVNLSDSFNLDRNMALKEITVDVVLDRRYRVKYAMILPISQTGVGIPQDLITVNGFSFGPTDTDKKPTKPIFADVGFQNHRFELDFMRAGTYFQPKIFGEYFSGNIKIVGNPANKQKDDPIEVSDSFNKFLFGIGAVGYQRQDQMLFKYEVAYTFADRGWLVDLGCRYDSNRGFVGGGWRMEKHKVGPLQVDYQGIYLEAGLKF